MGGGGGAVKIVLMSVVAALKLSEGTIIVWCVAAQVGREHMDEGKFNETQVTLIRSGKTIFMGVGSQKTGSDNFDKTRGGGGLQNKRRK